MDQSTRSRTQTEPQGQDSAASRILGSALVANDSLDTSADDSSNKINANNDAADQSRSATPLSRQRPQHDYGSADALPKPASRTNDRIYWRGSPSYLLTWEVLGIVIAVLFLILGGFVAKLRGQIESEWSKQVVQATRIAPSIWPILFSGILGNAIRQFANWRAERGIHLLVSGSNLFHSNS